jgi:ATP-dependent protease ClpP protease subunit
MADCANEGVEEVRLLLSSPGGNVTNGITAYNVLRGMPFRLVTHNVGTVASIGNVIFLAGEHRVACPDSTFWFHGVTYTTGGETFDEKGLRDRTDSVLEDQDRIAAILEERTTLTAEQLRPMFLEAATKAPTAALDSGIVHEIAAVEIPHGAPVVALVF